MWLKSANSRIENILLNVFGRSLDRDDGGVLPAGHLHLVREKKKRPLISDHIKGPLVTASRSPLMKALDRSDERLGL